MIDFVMTLINSLSGTISLKVVVVVSLCVLVIVFSAIYYFWKKSRELDLKNKELETDSNKKTFEMASKIYEKVIDITNSLEGKYISKEDIAIIKNEIKKTLNGYGSDLQEEADRIDIVESNIAEGKEKQQTDFNKSEKRMDASNINAEAAGHKQQIDFDKNENRIDINENTIIEILEKITKIELDVLEIKKSLNVVK